jgi:4-amino-4-deoxy-L-arabinose transferase-like glycosyltransferase
MESLPAAGVSHPIALRNAGLRNSLVAAAAALYLLGCAGLVETKRPWADEGWFVNISDSILTRGNTGVSVLRPDGTVMAPGRVVKDIDKGFYLWFPTQEFFNAGFYRVFGLGNLQMRAASAAWGAVLLISLYSLVHGLTASSLTAALALLLCSVDVAFLSAATEGRMDVMCAALWLSGLAVYARLRSKNLVAALVAGNSLVALSMLTHPIGLIGFPLLAVLVLGLDRKSLRPLHLAAAAVPYLFAIGAGALYISRDVEAFRSQFGLVSKSNRFTILVSPVQTVLREFSGRIATFYLPSSSSGAQRWLRGLIPLALGVGFLGAALEPSIRRERGARLLVILAGTSFLVMSVYDGAKQTYYLVHMTPLFCCVAALWLIRVWPRRGGRFLVAGYLAILLGLQLVWTGSSIIRDPLHRSFLPMSRYVRDRLHNCGDRCILIASAELGLELGFDDSRLHDDFLLGYRSGLKPDYIVMDGKGYYSNLEGLDTTYPAIAAYMHGLLARRYHKIYSDGYYDVFALNETAASPPFD